MIKVAVVELLSVLLLLSSSSSLFVVNQKSEMV